MPYLLDGNNLIGRARGKSRPSEEDVSSLIAEVAGRLRRTRATAVLYLDGGEGGRPVSLGTLSVRRSGSLTADDAIVAEIQRARSAREIVVVTGDRGLAERARAAGAQWVSPEQFWRRFGAAEAGGPSDAPARVDVEEWMRYFEDEKNRT